MAPDSYRSLYLSRAISPQIGLKLMAFDTTGSSILNPSGFIALTFQKVGLFVRHNAQRCRAGWHIEDPGDPRFYSLLWRFLQSPHPIPPCAWHPPGSITATFIGTKTQRLHIITLQYTFFTKMEDVVLFSVHRSGPCGVTMQGICKQSCQWNNAHYLSSGQSNILPVWSVYFMKVN